MTPRDALEVLGRALGNIGDEGYNVTHASLALTVLTNLVERAGEPVAVVIPNAVGVELAWLNPPSAGRPPVGTKLVALPPTAPGASHER